MLLGKFQMRFVVIYRDDSGRTESSKELNSKQPQTADADHDGRGSRNEENFCYYISRLIGAGLGFDGGLAEYVVVESRFAVPTGDFDPVLAAPLTDAGLTTYTAIKPALPSLAPRRHGGQCPQLPHTGTTATGSPLLNPTTPWPISETQPAIS